MIPMMVLLYNWIRENEYTPKRWRQGVVVNLFKKGDKADKENSQDKADQGNFSGMTLLRTVGKTFERSSTIE